MVKFRSFRFVRSLVLPSGRLLVPAVCITGLALRVEAGLTIGNSGASSNGTVEVQVDSGDTDIVTHNPFVPAHPLPYQTSDSVENNGGVISSATYDLNTNFLRWDFSQSFTGSGSRQFAFANGSVSDIEVAVNTPYVLTGHFAEAGGSPNNNAFQGQMNHDVILHDATVATDLFNYDFVTQASNSSSDLSGPGLTGTLLPGHQYSLSYQYYINNSEGDGHGATGGGFLNLQALAAPEPSTITLGSLSAAGLFLRRRRLFSME